MDTLTTGAIVATIVLLVVAALFLRLRRRRARLGELAQLPSRVTNPRLYTKLRSIRAWELKAGEGPRACNWARESDGQRFRTEQAVRLPIAGCGRTCNCEYLPVTEGRRRQRRGLVDAQTVLNLGDGKASNRRSKDGRRKGDHWGGDQR
ncbi:MAG: hypothetical protein AB7E72_12960 [Lysobacterales bacterium]